MIIINRQIFLIQSYLDINAKQKIIYANKKDLWARISNALNAKEIMHLGTYTLVLRSKR